MRTYRGPASAAAVISGGGAGAPAHLLKPGMPALAGRKDGAQQKPAVQLPTQQQRGQPVLPHKSLPAVGPPAMQVPSRSPGYSAGRPPAPSPSPQAQPHQQQSLGSGLLPTEALLRQLPLGDRPRCYKHVPSEVATHANWWTWKPQNGGGRPLDGASVLSYPRTAVSGRALRWAACARTSLIPHHRR
jgi:hypothetical protein